MFKFVHLLIILNTYLTFFLKKSVEGRSLLHAYFVVFIYFLLSDRCAKNVSQLIKSTQ